MALVLGNETRIYCSIKCRTRKCVYLGNKFVMRLGLGEFMQNFLSYLSQNEDLFDFHFDK